MNQGIFEAIRITRSEAEGAYGLLTLTHPGLDLAEWTDALPLFCEISKESGVVGLRDQRGCIHGLFTFRVQRGPNGDATLQLTEFASLRLPGTFLIEALWRFADDLAGELGLPAIAIDMQPSAAWDPDRQMLERRGFSIERISMRGKTRRRPLSLLKG